MAKILWLGDLINKTGFSRVSHAVLERLESKYDIAVMAVNYWGDPCPEQKKWNIYPASTESYSDPYGYSKLLKVVKAEKPDVVIGLNDVQISGTWASQLFGFRQSMGFCYIGYMPIDSEGGDSSMFTNVAKMDAVATYTPFAANILQEHTDKIVEVIPHGIDASVFYPIASKAELKQQIKADPSDFIVLNANRNQPRKRIDITICAFARFAVGKPNAKLYLHMGLKDQGWDVVKLFNREMKANGLDPKNRLYLTSLDMEPEKNKTTTEQLNRIYNACDVGINTCQGGGWELVNFEHAATKTPQVVPYFSCFPDIYGYDQAYCYAEIAAIETDKDCLLERAVVCEDSVVTQLDRLYHDKDYYSFCADKAYAATQKAEYNWDNIAAQFDSLIQRCLHEKENQG